MSNHQPIPSPDDTGAGIVYEHTSTSASNEPLVVRLLSENLQATKQWVQAGTVVLRKTVETVPQTVPVELGYEEVQMERRAVGRVLAEGESVQPRQEGDTLIIPVIAEELVVVKRRVLQEEIRIRKQRQLRQETVQDTVRREHLHVETSSDIEFLPTGDGTALG